MSTSVPPLHVTPIHVLQTVPSVAALHESSTALGSAVTPAFSARRPLFVLGGGGGGEGHACVMLLFVYVTFMPHPVGSGPHKLFEPTYSRTKLPIAGEPVAHTSGMVPVRLQFVSET